MKICSVLEAALLSISFFEKNQTLKKATDNFSLKTSIELQLLLITYYVVYFSGPKVNLHKCW